MRGRVFRRETSWAYVVDVGPDRGPNRKQRMRSGFQTRREAERALRDLLRQVDDGTFAEPSRLPLTEYLTEQWLPAVRASVRETTLSCYQRDIRVYIVPHIGHVLLEDLNPALLNKLYGRLLEKGRRNGGGLSVKTVRNVHGVLHKSLSDAVKWGLLSRNVAEHATPPRDTPVEMKIWTEEQVRTFLAGVDHDRMRALWYLIVTTGMRRGEALALRWANVDLDAQQVVIRQSASVAGYRMVVTEPKTRAGRRVIAIDPHTTAMLKAHREQQAEEERIADIIWHETDLVFCWEDGSPIHPQRVSKWFHQHTARLGLPRIRLHDVRHTYATAALRAGLPPNVVSTRLGHASVGITLDTYAHVLPAHDQAAAVQVAEHLLGFGPADS